MKKKKERKKIKNENDRIQRKKNGKYERCKTTPKIERKKKKKTSWL